MIAPTSFTIACSSQRSTHRMQHCCVSQARGAWLRAQAQTYEAGPGRGWSSERTWERVLRYPGGQERLIRYPAAQVYEDEEDSLATLDAVEKSSDWWGVERYYELSSDEEDDADGRAHSQATPSTSGRTAHKALNKGLPSSPAELLRYIASDEYRAAQAEQQRLVQSSYKILEHSPWLQSRPLFLLAVNGRNNSASTYTLRTRIQRQQAEDELTRVLGRRRADGSSLIRVEELRDGIVTFEDEADAHRYASMLEAEGNEAMTMQCDAHELFRESSNVRAVVVLILRCTGINCHLPLPDELAPSLRGQRSLEDPQDI